MAYSGNSSEEAMAKLQKLQKELSDKQDDLKEAEYDRYISDQQDMLDRLYQEYEELLTKKLEDFMTLVREGLGIANDNTAAISDYLSRVASENGYTEETKGLFDGITNGIRESVDGVIAKMAEMEASISGTLPQGQSATAPPPAATQTQAPVSEASQSANETLVNAVSHKSKEPANAVSHKKPSSETSLGELAGLSHAMPQSAEETQKRKSARFPGFKKGGVVSVDDIEEQVKKNGDDGIASVRNGEAVLTKEQTDMLRQYLKEQRAADGRTEYVADPAECMKLMQMPVPAAIPQPVPNAKGVSNVVNIDNITLPNVKDYEAFKSDMFRDMQNDRKFEGMINNMGMRKLSGGGSLSKRGCQF